MWLSLPRLQTTVLQTDSIDNLISDKYNKGCLTNVRQPLILYITEDYKDTALIAAPIVLTVVKILVTVFSLAVASPAL